MTINMVNGLLDSGRDKKPNMQLIKWKGYRFEFRQAGNKCLIQYLIYPYNKYKDFPFAPYIYSITREETEPTQDENANAEDDHDSSITGEETEPSTVSSSATDDDRTHEENAKAKDGNQSSTATSYSSITNASLVVSTTILCILLSG